MARLDEMVYGDVASARKSVEEASSVSEIERAVDAAVEIDSEAKQRYWECAGKGPGLLESSRWESSLSRSGSGVPLPVTLELNDGGAASITVGGELPQENVSQQHEQLARLAGSVSSWRSDAAELVAEQRWIGTDSGASYQGPGACDFPFTLTLTVDGKDEDFSAKLVISKTPRLFVLGNGFTAAVKE
ncbi:hypothetical protein [Arachnia propionica]|uniref:Uncharacterized protein n=1 Tax=Arachnia propionica TaxID=1750 RepID=A0A3P1WWE1_9ACTN|nr:hypothetical protein [Arachnia propionica]RRD50535.1 hypothetical protein EII35_03800 [Arachnia propionica]